MTKGFIRKFWLIHTAKYYFVMFIIFYLMTTYNENYLTPPNGLFLLPADLLGFGTAYGGFFDLTLFMFIFSNIFCGGFALGVFITFFVCIGGSHFYDGYDTISKRKKRAYDFFVIGPSKQNSKWVLIQIFYLYSIPILALNTKVLIF